MTLATVSECLASKCCCVDDAALTHKVGQQASEGCNMQLTLTVGTNALPLAHHCKVWMHAQLAVLHMSEALCMSLSSSKVLFGPGRHLMSSS